MVRYLNEIRLGKKKSFFRDIIRDVRREFDLQSSYRPVPHIRLFGRYDTSQGYKVKQRTKNVLANYRVVPYRVAGFGSFSDSGVVYAEVVPSERLQELRRDLSNVLQPVTHNYRNWDTDQKYNFHIRIEKNLGQETARILDYLRDNYEVDLELYAKRVTALNNRDMMWEWDLPRGTELSSQEATSRESWKKTETALDNKVENKGNDQSYRTGETCVRCKSQIVSGGVKFKRRTYCDQCISVFESIAQDGVVMRSRHGRSDYNRKPYIVTGGGTQFIEHSQTEALARGKELAENLGTRGLFIYWKHGSHWVLDRYLAEHPRIAANVKQERRRIRGQTPIQAMDSAGSDDTRIEIRPEGDAIVDSTVIDDSVVNRSSVDNQDEL